MKSALSRLGVLSSKETAEHQNVDSHARLEAVSKSGFHAAHRKATGGDDSHVPDDDHSDAEKAGFHKKKLFHHLGQIDGKHKAAHKAAVRFHNHMNKHYAKKAGMELTHIASAEKSEHVIHSPSENGYWHNKHGWVEHKKHATKFPHKKFNLPHSANNDAHWVEHKSKGKTVAKSVPNDWSAHHTNMAMQHRDNGQTALNAGDHSKAEFHFEQQAHHEKEAKKTHSH